MAKIVNLLCVLALAWAGSGFALPGIAYAQTGSSSEFQKLDALVAAGDYRAVQRQLRKIPVPDESRITWLEERANEGHPPLQYELSALLHKRDLAQSLKWYARGLLGRALDAATCSKAGGYLDLNDLVEPVRADGIAQPHLLEAAIREALAQPRLLEPKPWAHWMCLAGGNELTAKQKLKARDEALDDMHKEAKAFYLFAKAVELGKRRAFPVQDTGLFVGEYGSERAAWPDDRRLLLVAADRLTAKGNDFPRQLYMWDMDRATSTLVTPSGWFAYAVCVEGLTTNVPVRPSPGGVSKSFLMHGRFPDLRFSPLDAQWNTHRPFDAAVRCNQPRRRPPPGLNDDEVRWLHESHGYIETRAVGFGSEARSTLVKPDGSRVSLPAAQLMDSTHVLAYAQWKRAYLLQGQWRASGSLALKQRERGQETVLLWMYPDGRTDEVVIPYGYWDQTIPPSSMYEATRRGTVIAGTRYERNDQPGFAGLYLFEDAETPVLLLPGWIRVLAISPNGCNVAVSHQPNSKPSEPSNIKVIQLCRGAVQ